MKRTMILAALAAAFAGCKRNEEPKPGAAAQPAAAAAPGTAKQPLARPKVGEVAVAGGHLPMFARLAAEAKNRPGVPLPAESVLAAFTKAGIQTSPPRQFIARLVDASYCVGTRTTAGLPVTICEYRDAPSAAKGRERSLAKFPNLPRDILVNGQTTLTLTKGGIPPAALADVEKVTAVFTKL